MTDEMYVTKTGRVLTDADLDALADEAERGYDVERIKRVNRERYDEETTHALNEIVRRGERRARLFFAGLGALLGLALGFALFTHEHRAQPYMPCARDEVQVWVDGEDETKCVLATDHASHAGG